MARSGDRTGYKYIHIYIYIYIIYSFRETYVRNDHEQYDSFLENYYDERHHHGCCGSLMIHASKREIVIRYYTRIYAFFHLTSNH